MDDNPRYHALSYTWEDAWLQKYFEDPDDSKVKVFIDKRILLDGQKVKVTRSLWVALWHFRRAAGWHLDHPNSQTSEFGDYSDIPEGNKCVLTADTYLWVDALCINQDDVLERNSQVGRMGELYKNAECVHCWIGPAHRDVSLMIELL